MAKTIVGELKDLYVKYGGNAEDVANVKTVAEILNLIENVAVGSDLPSVTADDNGKVMKVVDGEWTKGDDNDSLPTVTTDDNGKVLKVSSGAWSVEDENVELPTVTADDNGKVLMVVNGAWAVADLPSDDTPSEETT